jgi:hypothetical protein
MSGSRVSSPGLRLVKRRFYYLFKPYLPWRLRIAVRRISAKRIRRANAAVWPVDPAAVRCPAGWAGWPEGKRITVVLTHDVEGPEGLAKCRRLAEYEASMGFRSSFNFIPEGDYAVSADLRAWLGEQGFEVGVHDLRHDGKLYVDRETYRANARRINGYLKDWSAVGFRSGFMLRELEWMHDLEIAYDASTFDTDPFEPQPDPASTIFPHWMPASGGAANGRGYFEFPYTLPQDSTLFLVFQEASPRIWLEKLDWLARQRALVLVNVHPDYLQFPGEAPSARTFPIEYYGQLLQRIKDHYAGQYWHPLPRELAAWLAERRRDGAALTLSA